MFTRVTANVFLKMENVFSKRNVSNIAFIGLGNMGSKMAKNLVKKGHNLKVFDIEPNLKVDGTTLCKKTSETVKNCEIVITMLPNGSIVKETLLGNEGILKSATKGALLVDCSTIDPLMAKDLNKLARNAGMRFLDAPVSGGVTGAEAATLTFMVGGEEADVQQVEPVLLGMGSRVVHCGQTGNGQIAKICNNLILGITMIGTAEALNLGAKLGLDPKLLTDIVNTSTGRSWSSDTYNPVPGILPNVPSSKGYEGGFLVKLIAKDLALAQDVATASSTPIPLGASAHQWYRTLMVAGMGDKDFSIIYKFLQGSQ